MTSQTNIFEISPTMKSVVGTLSQETTTEVTRRKYIGSIDEDVPLIFVSTWRTRVCVHPPPVGRIVSQPYVSVCLSSHNVCKHGLLFFGPRARAF
jgi:hypothetical protein